MHQIVNIDSMRSNGTPTQMFETSPSPGFSMRSSHKEFTYWEIPILKSPIEEKKFEDDEEEDEEEEDEDNPLLFVDVNLGPDRSERIVVYDGDTAEGLADDFAKKHNLNQNMKIKLI